MRKQILALGLALWSIGSASAQDHTDTLATELDSVTLYLEGAQLWRSGSLTLAPGETEITIEGLSPTLLINTLQVSGPASVTMLSVEGMRDYAYQREKTKREEEFGEELRRLTASEEVLVQEMEVIKLQLSYLLQNRTLPNTRLDIGEIKKIYGFFTQTYDSLLVREAAINDSLGAIEERREIILLQYNEISAADATSTVAKIRLNTQEEQSVNLRVSYYVPQALWMAKYNVRVDDPQRPVTVELVASIAQATGENWKDVGVTLTNYNPTLPGVLPQLRPYNIMSGNNRVVWPELVDEGEFELGQQLRSDATNIVIRGSSSLSARANRSAQAQQVNVVVAPQRFEVRLSEPYTLMNESEPQEIPVRSFEIPTHYEHIVVPLAEEEAYWVAHLTDFHEQKILPGPAFLFVEGAYQGETYLNPTASTDTLTLSLGRDPGVYVRRTLYDSDTEYNFGNTRTESRTWQLQVFNQKGMPVSLTILDQLPLTLRKDIKVEYPQLGGAKVNEERGEATWELQLPPYTQRQILYEYEIKMPQSYIIPVE